MHEVEQKTIQCDLARGKQKNENKLGKKGKMREKIQLMKSLS